ncbi:type 1 glutamine amidotransferase [Sporolactobacillus sp. KGMB 08714]|uniref:type 1 glutamine amidotransferase n=1 Tax=Sporolactobacillus sp. KGMB 08714 TaxID=3064704 RepID=UPI002FBE2EE6
MHIHYFQHVPFESPGNIAVWAAERHYSFIGTHFFESHKLPDAENIDLLVIMGGPMNIYEEEKYPWLREEKKFIRDVLERGLPVLGICLGAQLLADCLDGKIYPGEEKEIGWFPVFFPENRKGPFRLFPGTLDVFHWHGDTFTLPEGAVRTASSAACRNQAFIYGDRAAGLQFHIEMNEETISRLIAQSQDEPEGGRFIQKKREMTGRPDKIERNKTLLFRFLDEFLKGASAGGPQ